MKIFRIVEDKMEKLNSAVPNFFLLQYLYHINLFLLLILINLKFTRARLIRNLIFRRQKSYDDLPDVFGLYLKGYKIK
jgi:hypothetical protein